MFCGKCFFSGRPVFWFRKSSCFFSQKRVSRDAMFTSCFADWRLGEPLWNGVESPRHEVKNVIVKRNCAFEFLRQKCPLHVFFFVCCHVCRVCVGSLLQSSFSVHTSLIFPSQKQKSLGRAILPDCKPSIGHLVLRRKEMLAGPLSRSVSFGPSRGSFDFSLSGSNFVQANSLTKINSLLIFGPNFFHLDLLNRAVPDDP